MRRRTACMRAIRTTRPTWRPRAANLLPARWQDLGPGGRDPGASKLRLGSECRSGELSRLEREPEAGPAQLPALAVASSQSGHELTERNQPRRHRDTEILRV